MKVKFVPQNVECEIQLGQSVMHVAQDHGLYVKSVCKGVPSCAECRVRIVDGEHNVLPPGSEELALIGTGFFIDRRRLSCQLKCFGDITVDMSEQIAKQQGLVTGQKKKKLAIKDDRIEDAHAIRGDEGSVDSDEVDEEAPEVAPFRSPVQSRERKGAPPSQHRAGEKSRKVAQAEGRIESRNQQRPAGPSSDPSASRDDGPDDGPDDGHFDADDATAADGSGASISSAGPESASGGGRRRRRRRGGRRR